MPLELVHLDSTNTLSYIYKCLPIFQSIVIEKQKLHVTSDQGRRH